MGKRGRLTVKAENGVLPARGKSVAVACAAVCTALALAAAGCGSSGSTTTSTTTTTVTTQGTTTAKSKTAASGGLKAVTAPKYASPSASEPAKSGVVQITYRNIAIDPDTVRAKVGSTIRWTNDDPEKCNVTSEGGPVQVRLQGLRRRWQLRTEARPAGRHPLRVHLLPDDDERHDRSGGS